MTAKLSRLRRFSLTGIILVLSILPVLVPQPVYAQPILIYDVYDLQNINNDLTADYELANDIDASATSGWNWNAGRGVYEGFLPIGESPRFTGSLNGRGYTISGLYVNRTGTIACGLFSWTEGTRIEDVSLVDVDITASSYAGALVGLIYGEPDPCTIRNCHSTGVVTGGRRSGGLIGMAYSANVSECSSSCSVTTSADQAGGFIGHFDGEGAGTITESFATGNVVAGTSDAGGFVGLLDDGAITQCYATGNVTCDYGAGGFIGEAESDALITDCYARGNVNAASWAGGFVEDVDATAVIERCLSTGSVTGAVGQTGGFVADNSGTITACFWDITTSGQATSAGGTGKTTAEMQQITTFSGWDIQTSTTELNNGYPFLSWQIGSPPVWLITGGGSGSVSPGAAFLYSLLLLIIAAATIIASFRLFRGANWISVLFSIVIGIITFAVASGMLEALGLGP